MTTKTKTKKQPADAKMMTMQIPVVLKEEVRTLVKNELRDREERRRPLDRKKMGVDLKALEKANKAVKALHQLIKPIEKQGERLGNIDRQLSSKDDDWVSDQLDLIYELNEKISNLLMSV